ncbi:MAG: Crp/Fnr family transcriptional regulator [Mobiluncus porci]|uniref:Crp/Fnr family transcriptional regulator n=1 Tax=Mobiluncus porci TaxID=2652278 RepID=A0A7K0K0Z7_9ACTO|nr:Crp/Fnr family transcriptional regulator [Mobiluncus porci]MDD7540873.1 Crp/Fnr family transcriptional regulator [Mobiluncus porci]MDY5748902.1 Crp/Fnr family transcriptional regulator [Mobiluncus porci]MST49161.1 Crp/Fnr family transcriptional regulator [Mobiluncus porci]
MAGETNLATMRFRTGELFDQVARKLPDKIHGATMEGRFQFLASGDPLDRIFSLQSGKVKLTRTSSMGRDHVLEILGEGDVLGLESLAGENVWFYTATSLEPAEIQWIRVEDMRKYLASNPNLEVQFLRLFGAQTQQRYERTMDLRDLDVPGRVAAVLLLLMRRFGEIGEAGVVLPRGLTQSELAQMVGSSRETTNKVLADFMARGWIQQQTRVITILDAERLIRRAS